jgi:hypothetical protein
VRGARDCRPSVVVVVEEEDRAARRLVATVPFAAAACCASLRRFRPIKRLTFCGMRSGEASGRVVSRAHDAPHKMKSSRECNEWPRSAAEGARARGGRLAARGGGRRATRWAGSGPARGRSERARAPAGTHRGRHGEGAPKERSPTRLVGSQTHQHRKPLDDFPKKGRPL